MLASTVKVRALARIIYVSKVLTVKLVNGRWDFTGALYVISRISRVIRINATTQRCTGYDTVFRREQERPIISKLNAASSKLARV